MFKKALKILKLTFQMLLVVVLGFVMSLGIYVSVSESIRFPTGSELAGLDNISGDLKKIKIVEAQQRNLNRQFADELEEDDDGFAKMSGTYVTHDRRFYVITAAHGIVGDCDHMFVATDSEHIYDCVQYILIDKFIDYAIIEIEEVPRRTAVKLTDVIPSSREWRQETSALNEVFYTGYPNSLGPLTFRGSVAGVSPEKYIYLHSYAWPGSSGSGVFSYDGNMIGIIIALNVGFTAAGYDVLEDLVIVTPLFMIDWDTAYEIMGAPDPSGDTGDTGE